MSNENVVTTMAVGDSDERTGKSITTHGVEFCDNKCEYSEICKYRKYISKVEVEIDQVARKITPANLALDISISCKFMKNSLEENHVE